MEQELIEIRDQQKTSWDKFSPGWKKWDDHAMNFLRPMGEAIIENLALKPTDKVLDIATGTGEPGLTIASIVNKGSVTATDLSSGMIAVTRGHADARGLKNFDALVADACELPFPANSFDAVSVRMGFMFFPDMQLAANEMARVLRSGGRIALSAWAGPEANLWIALMMGTLKKYVDIPAPPPGSPGMFRCAAPGLMKGILEKAGFKNVQESTVEGHAEYENADFYRTMMTEVAAPVVAGLSQADEATCAQIKKISLNR